MKHTQKAIANRLKAMPKGKIGAIVCVPLLLVEAVFVPAAIALDGEKLYQLCSRFPLNSQCQGYETPISLGNHSGKTGNCIFKKNEVENRGLCKITVNETGITIYQETGKKLEIINDQKPTRTIEITATSVSRIEYREDEKIIQMQRFSTPFYLELLGCCSLPTKRCRKFRLITHQQLPKIPAKNNKVWTP
ncbi:MAG: hypothetical protein RM021_020430 [Nostoc sp. EkiNYC01]|nr:hypothetical protein [Nostoc sp. EkiNYC01]